METTKLEMPRAEARRLYREYRKHQHYSTPMDAEIRRAYQLLAQGRLIIQAIESVKQAGLGPDGFPKLALCRADRPACRISMHGNGSATMFADDLPRAGKAAASLSLSFPSGAFGSSTNWRNARAILPPVPLHLRPRRGLANYHILWEAEWTPVPPRDPYLLRRIGRSDMWLVVAMWDLTEVERAALAARIN
jgi:hypothetical protein